MLPPIFWKVPMKFSGRLISHPPKLFAAFCPAQSCSVPLSPCRLRIISSP